MKIYCLFLFFLPKIFRMRTGIKQRRNNLSVVFFRFVWGYDIRMKHTIGTCQIHWLTCQMIILYKYNIYRRLNYTLRMMINNNVFFFDRIPFYIYLLGSRLYGYILIVILLFSSVLCHVIKSGKSGNFQIFLLM